MKILDTEEWLGAHEDPRDVMVWLRHRENGALTVLLWDEMQKDEKKREFWQPLFDICIENYHRDLRQGGVTRTMMPSGKVQLTDRTGHGIMRDRYPWEKESDFETSGHQ